MHPDHVLIETKSAATLGRADRLLPNRIRSRLSG
jgi:hypothetical protein